MKRQRISTTVPRAAQKIVKGFLERDQKRNDEWVRTTFRAPAKTLIELKIHAMHEGVDMNDLLLLGAHLVLRRRGLQSHVDAHLRAKMPGKVE
jgi:hypothetical protein